MANISNRISLEGGADVRQQLLAIADQGQRAFDALRSLADNTKIDTSGLQQLGSQAQQASSAVAGTGESMLGFASKAAIGIAALVAGAAAIVSSLANSAAESAAAVQHSATQFGVTVESYQRLKQVADDANLSVGQFNQIIGNVDRAATQAAGGLSRIIPAGSQLNQVFLGLGPIADESLKKLGGSLAVAQQSLTGSVDVITKFGDQSITVLNGVSTEASRSAQQILQAKLIYEGFWPAVGSGAPKAGADFAKASDSIRGGAKQAASALAELGISGETLSRLSQEQKLALIAQQLDKIPDSAGKASIATKLLGADWRNLIEFFKQGPDAILNGGNSIRNLSTQEIAAGKALKDQTDDLRRAFDGLKNRIGTIFAPGGTTKAEWLTGLIDGANKLLQSFLTTNDAKKALQETDAGGFLEKFQSFVSQSGQTGLAKAIEIIRNVSSDLAQVWNNVLIPAGTVIISAFNGIAEQINSAFGTEISGRFVAIVAAIGLVTGAFGGLRAVISPIIALVGFVLASFASLGPILLAGGLAVRTFWTEFRAGGTAAVAAVRAESAGFAAAFSQLARGNFTAAWELFKTAGLAAFNILKESLGKIFGGEGSAVFTNITRLISGVALAASGLAAIFNSIFGTNINAQGLLLIAVLAQLTGAFALLRAAGFVLAFVLSPIGAAFAAITASAIILARQFPDLGRSWQQVTEAFSSLLSGDIGKAFDKLKQAFTGVWDNLQKEGKGTFLILALGAVAAFAAMGAAVTAVIPVFSGLVAVIAAIAAALTALAFNPFVLLAVGVVALVTVLAALILKAVGVKNAFTDLVADPITNAFNWIAQAFDTNVVQPIKRFISDTTASITQWVTTSVGNAWNWIADAFDQNVIQPITSKINALLDLIKRVASSASAIFSGSNTGGGASSPDSVPSPGSGFAAGGYTGHGGRLQPAGIVHRGEYVQPQHVVRQPGVLALMEMLRAYGGNLNKVFSNLGLMRGYFDGGLVAGLSNQLAFEPLRLSFAEGGLAGGRSLIGDINLQTDFGPIRVSIDRDGLSQLKKAAVKRNIGKNRSPGWTG